MSMIDPVTASAVIDLPAYAENLRTLSRLAAPATLMAVVKADGYGHGMLASARAARGAGVEWIGVATPEEALALRADGDRGRLLCWLYGPSADLGALVTRDVDVSVSAPNALTAVVEAARAAERTARIHLKIDTGLSRNGVPAAEWPGFCREAGRAETDGLVEVVGVWSHLAAADEPGHPSLVAQQQAFERALAVAAEAGLRPRLRHLANSAAAMVHPDLRYDLVRAGIASYGIEPGPGLAELAGITLLPVMRLRAQLVAVRSVDAGAGVSYGHTWTSENPTRLGLIPLGYADGIPRHASSVAEVECRGRRFPVRGRVCMDQFVVDFGAEEVKVGEEVTLFGRRGGLTAEDWAEVCGTIGYEIITRIGTRVPRVYRHHPDGS